MREMIYGPTLATDNDIYLFREGTHRRIYTFLGARRGERHALRCPGSLRERRIGHRKFQLVEQGQPQARAALGFLRNLGGLHPRRRSGRNL